MQIKQVSLTNLFGRFNHKINLNTEEKITIIHGPNGIGKTILLRMMYELFSLESLNIFFKIPFSSFEIIFDNQQVFSIQKKQVEVKIGNDLRQLKLAELDEEHAYLQKSVPVLLVRHLNSKDEVIFDFELSKDEIKSYNNLKHPQHLRSIRKYISSRFPYLEEVHPGRWIDLRTGERISIDEIVQKYNIENIFDDINKYNSFQELITKINVQFIETQRLLKLAAKKKRYYTNDVGESEEEYSYTVEFYSDKLASSIKDYLGTYAVLTQKLDRSFPFKLLELDPADAKTIKELKDKLSELESQRKRLIDIGLLDEEESHNFRSMLDKIEDESRAVLTVYTEDIEQKFDIFRDLAVKIELFKEIIDKKFNYKSLKINKEFGFAFYTPEGQHLSLKDLSSGEQHEIVLLYEFLFNIQPNSLILIDEPELSLHVTWQREFLSDLQKISKLANLNFLIATHSPSIIADRFDLTVDLASE